MFAGLGSSAMTFRRQLSRPTTMTAQVMATDYLASLQSKPVEHPTFDF